MLIYKFTFLCICANFIALQRSENILKRTRRHVDESHAPEG